MVASNFNGLLGSIQVPGPACNLVSLPDLGNSSLPSRSNPLVPSSAGIFSINKSLVCTMLISPRLRISTLPSALICGCNKRSRANDTWRFNSAFLPLIGN